MDAKKTIKQLVKTGWIVKKEDCGKKHFEWAGTGNTHSRPTVYTFTATLFGCDYRLFSAVEIGVVDADPDKHTDIQVLHPTDKPDGSDIMRCGSVKAAIKYALMLHDAVQPKKRPSYDALFDGSDAHLLH
jgi:hypothetical protein